MRLQCVYRVRGIVENGYGIEFWVTSHMCRICV